MVVRTRVPCLQDKNRRGGGGMGSRGVLILESLKVPSAPLSPKLSRQMSIRRNHSVTATVTIAGPSHSTIPAGKSSHFSDSTMAQTETENVCTLNTDPTTQEFQGEVKVSTALPTKSMLEKAADLPVVDVDGKARPFKSLYWSDSTETKRVMIIFIRHFFCGNCQEYLRTLAATIPLSCLPSDTSIQVVGCGSHTLISSYVELTGCPYPIFADPSKQLYSILGMARTLSLGSKDPDYIHHTIVFGALKSIAQGLKRIGSGDAMQGGDMKQVGGEFLFEVAGSAGTTLAEAKQGHASLRKVQVSWCHRMKNTRDHAELPDLKNALGLGEVNSEEGRRTSERSWRNSGLVRSLSNRRQSLSLSRSRRRSRSAGRNASSDALQKIHTVNEEGR